MRRQSTSAHVRRAGRPPSRNRFERALLLYSIPKSELSDAEATERSNTPFPPALTDYRLAKEFGWDHWTIQNQPNAWLNDIVACMNAQAEASELMNDPARRKQREARQGLLKGRTLQEYADDMGLEGTDEEIAAYLAGQPKEEGE